MNGEKMDINDKRKPEGGPKNNHTGLDGIDRNAKRNVKPLISTNRERRILTLFSITMRNTKLKEPAINCNGEISHHSFLSLTAETRTCFAHVISAIYIILTSFMWRMKTRRANI
jgi:hypothetical protein